MGKERGLEVAWNYKPRKQRVKENQADTGRGFRAQ
jgi:hypothetical protein